MMSNLFLTLFNHLSNTQQWNPILGIIVLQAQVSELMELILGGLKLPVIRILQYSTSCHFLSNIELGFFFFFFYTGLFFLKITVRFSIFLSFQSISYTFYSASNNLKFIRIVKEFRYLYIIAHYSHLMWCSPFLIRNISSLIAHG